MFDYEGNDNIIIDPEQSFEINVFNKILDNAISSLKSRFEQTKEFRQYWGFVFDIKITRVKRIAQTLQRLDTALADGDNSDISGIELCDKI
jgi:molybdopterin converting factor small subunit